MTVKVGRYRVPWGGDIITHVNETPVTTLVDLAKQIETRKAGDKVIISCIRNERDHSVTVKLILRPNT